MAAPGITENRPAMALLAQFLPFWKGLTLAQQQMLSAATYERQFEAGALLHSGSNDCVGLLLVTSGQLRAFLLSDEGKELTLYRLLERDLCLFSASCIMNDIEFDVMVSAECPTTVLQISADVYQQLMDQSLPVVTYTNQLMASRFSDVMWLMDQTLNKKLDSRLAALLLEERALRNEDTLPLTHEQLSNHLGTVREVVSRMLKYFQSEGLVKLGRSNIHLLDLVRLQQLAQASLRF